MALTEAAGPAGPPWERPLAGALDRYVVRSELLTGNPLGDPERRPLYVYRPPGVEAGAGEGLPAVYVIQGYTGQLDMWLGRSAYEPTMVERLDAMFAAGECPDAIVVFADAWTRYGGSQFLNSAGTGRYMDYLCDEVVGFVDARYPTTPDRDYRGIAGKSSGGYGAMVGPMLRPDVFGALASHAGDALFECCYLPDFRAAARSLRDEYEGSYDVVLERFEEADRFDYDKQGNLVMLYGCALAYSPDPDRTGTPLLPFDLETGAPIEDVWARWLALDPVRMAPAHADALASMRRIYLDAGRADEYYLDLGAAAFSRELDKIGAEHTLELFDGKHGGMTYRYPGAIRELVLALGE
ncbi:MAG TPA: alpha/beta hydrolase-fold protein [Solirubrobacterales bacterium]